ncbi:30S ribosomal protein S13 [Candidatus Woesearchaeota archaeon]|nr:30S ribosomal protein S13 [Candidatus Woesearchaeota archaeon]HIH38935.1 30S ribosomal protein S13 [Candidatus Woesearchaeota archaeon]HIH49356.1 30S ribosomal protein S13 [Candidatus Woesearchaeota archaeon]HIJ03146.1 30S ribosomal protein S13 [Candidatus Woesearchaeota archaeon]
MTEKPDNYRHIVRIANTDLVGTKHILYGMMKIPGVKLMYANAVLGIAGIDKTKKVGLLTDEDVKKIESALHSPEKMPTWLKNRRFDPETGEDKHLLTSDLKFTKDNDLKQLKKIKAYRGIRHMQGLPTRGQRTQGHFRRGRSLGVAKKKGKGGRV